MMEVKFYKYQGAGNDFILIDNREKGFNPQQDLVKLLCDRRFGIGADGLMLLENEPGFDFKMYYANADGREGSMCGNGGRCIVSFANMLGIINENASFLASDGTHSAKISGKNVILGMKAVTNLYEKGNDYVLDTGSPHFVRMVKNLESVNVPVEGRAIRNSEPYAKEGINVNFIELLPGGLFVRTFERGVEDETLACGTGVTAAALALARSKNYKGQHAIDIITSGGKLKVSFTAADDGGFKDIYLEGPAKFVFEGKYVLQQKIFK